MQRYECFSKLASFFGNIYWNSIICVGFAIVLQLALYHDIGMSLPRRCLISPLNQTRDYVSDYSRTDG